MTLEGLIYKKPFKLGRGTNTRSGGMFQLHDNSRTRKKGYLAPEEGALTYLRILRSPGFARTRRGRWGTTRQYGEFA